MLQVVVNRLQVLHQCIHFDQVVLWRFKAGHDLPLQKLIPVDLLEELVVLQLSIGLPQSRLTVPVEQPNNETVSHCIIHVLWEFELRCQNLFIDFIGVVAVLTKWQISTQELEQNDTQ